MTSHLRARSGRSVAARPTPFAAPAALVGRLAVAVLAAALLVAVLEAAVLDMTVLQNHAGGRSTAAERWQLADVLAGGAALVVPLTLMFGGWRLVRDHARAQRELAVDDLPTVRRGGAADGRVMKNGHVEHGGLQQGDEQCRREHRDGQPTRQGGVGGQGQGCRGARPPRPGLQA